MPECPFKVGDTVHEVHLVDAEQLDSSRPDAIVTEITERGFKYEYDYPIPHGRVQWGEMLMGGECFEAGFNWWRKVE